MRAFYGFDPIFGRVFSSKVDHTVTRDYKPKRRSRKLAKEMSYWATHYKGVQYVPGFRGRG